MATVTRNREEHTNRDFDLIEAMLDELPEIAARWAALSDGERASVGLEWGNDIGAIAQFLADHQRGYLTPAQEVRLVAVLRRLRQGRSLLEGLGLYYPPEAELAALRPVEAAGTPAGSSRQARGRRA